MIGLGEKSVRPAVAPRLKLRATPAAEKSLRSGHPWLFAASIREQNRSGQLGELGVVYDRKNRFLALGLLDPASPIRLRVLHTGKAITIDRTWWLSRLEACLDRRKTIFARNFPADRFASSSTASPSLQTTGYRCVHGESDGWPGLVLDRYDTTFVIKLYTAAWLPRLSELGDVMTDGLQPKRLVLRLSRNIQDIASEFGFEDGQILRGPPLTKPVIFQESGLYLEADVLRGQKTGFFLDQRENRRHVEGLSAGRDVLNVFSFSGAFSIYGARGGARSTTDLDISPYALRAARTNFRLNESNRAISGCPRKFIQADAFEWLRQNKREQFDLIVLDPPSLAKKESERRGALRAYQNLALAAINHLRRNGILVACSCSAHVSEEEFFQSVRQAADRSGRRFAETAKTDHPPDHPAAFKEARYLKAIYLKQR